MNKFVLEKERFFRDITAYRTVSIKWPGLIFSQESLLNDQKNEGLKILSNWSYNRMVRVTGIIDIREKTSINTHDKADNFS